MRVLVIGGGAREHALGVTLHRAGAEVVVASPNANPGLDRIARSVVRLDPTQAERIAILAVDQRVDYAVIGPEAGLAAGAGDLLRAHDVPVVGPSKDGAQIETSKRFCRELLTKYRIDASPKFVVLRNAEEVDARVKEFPGPFVVKPVGLTSGKGVWVQGADFQTSEEGATYAKRLLQDPATGGVLLEERLDGEEFSQMAFVTDSGIYPMPAVKDFKRALDGDQGANTGGMGAFSQRDHLLPFLPESARNVGLDILRRSVDALRQEGISYRGVLYGGFMMTASGPVLMEFNARFGDPEALNVLSLYEDGDFPELLHGVAVGRVDPTLVRFRLRASVTKYLVPPGYGANPVAGGILQVDEPSIEALGVHLFYGSVEAAGPSAVRLSKSRGLALVGEASAIFEASARVDAALPFVRGTYFVRHDIATKEDLTRRTEHMRHVLSPSAKPSPLPLSVAPADAPPSSAASASQVM